MKIAPCPICNNIPKIKELPHGRKGERRRQCFCPRFDSVVPGLDGLNYSGFTFYGDGDANTIYKFWNKAIDRYNSNKNKDWFERDFSRWDERQDRFYNNVEIR